MCKIPERPLHNELFWIRDLRGNIVVPIPIPRGNLISLTLPSLAKFLPSHTPHPSSYSHFPPNSLTHYSLSPFTHVNKKFDLQLMCKVLNKLAKLQTDKCNNIFSKIENSKPRTCHRMHCEETANCKLTRRNLCGVPPGFVLPARTISLKVFWSPTVGSLFFLPLPQDFRQLNSHPAGLSLILSPHPQYFPQFPAAVPRKISHAGLYSDNLQKC